MRAHALTDVVTYVNSAIQDKVLGAFANLQKATVSFVMSVCPSVSLSLSISLSLSPPPLSSTLSAMEQFGSYWTDCYEI